MFAFLLVPVVAVNIVVGGCPAYPPVMDDRGVLVYYSCYDPGTNTIYLADRSKMTLAHEMGHAYDFQVLRSNPWGREWFAENYARCALLTRRRKPWLCGWLFRRSVLHAAAAARAHR